MTSQRPIELILGRNFLASISTPAFLVDAEGVIVFYNEAAGALLGRRFEEAGNLPASEWLATFGPFGADGEPMPFEELPLTRATRHNRAAHARFRIRSVQGEEHQIEASAFPIVGADGFSGAIAVFWPQEEG